MFYSIFNDKLKATTAYTLGISGCFIAFFYLPFASNALL